MASSVWVDLDRGGTDFSGQLIGPAADNTAAPPFTFLGDLTSGYASSAVGVMDIMASGVDALRATTAAITSPAGLTLGTAALPWGNVFLGSAKKIDFGNGNVTLTHSTGLLTLTGGSFLLPNGTAGAPSVAFASDPATGLLWTSAHNIDISGNGAIKMRLLDSTQATYGLTMAATGFFAFGGNVVANPDLFLKRIATGQCGLQTDSTHGVALDVQTDSTLKLFARDGSSAATMQANLFNVAAGGSTTISTGVGSVKMSTSNAATNTAWIPMAYAGTTYFIPAWTTNAP